MNKWPGSEAGIIAQLGRHTLCLISVLHYYNLRVLATDRHANYTLTTTLTASIIVICPNRHYLVLFLRNFNGTKLSPLVIEGDGTPAVTGRARPVVRITFPCDLPA